MASRLSSPERDKLKRKSRDLFDTLCRPPGHKRDRSRSRNWKDNQPVIPRVVNQERSRRWRSCSRTIPRTVRIGIDCGGVLSRIAREEHWHWDEVRDAMWALSKMVNRFGAENVHIVSKCGPNMEQKTKDWLFRTMRIDKIGLGEKNVHFCRQRTGEFGKGPVAELLQLTHFVDDNDACLWSVYGDPKGNAGEWIRRCNGKLYQFSRDGLDKDLCYAFENGGCKRGFRCKYKHTGRLTARRWPARDPPPPCVVPVDNWKQLIDDLCPAADQRRR